MTEQIIDFSRFKFCECGFCNELILIKDKRGRYRRFKNGHNGKGKNNYYYGKKGKEHPTYKNGRTMSEGYWYILMSDHPYRDANDRVAEHRLVVEAREGRYLLPIEEVHHINRIKTDNRSENLMLFANSSEHSKYEMLGNKIAKKDMSNRFCLLCNSNKTYTDKKEYAYWYKFENGFICNKCHRRNLA